jgi:hypothetical protein
MVYGVEVVHPTDLDYRALRVMMYKELEAKAFFEDTMDQLDEARVITLLHLAKYQQVLHRYHSRHV